MLWELEEFLGVGAFDEDEFAFNWGFLQVSDDVLNGFKVVIAPLFAYEPDVLDASFCNLCTDLVVLFVRTWPEFAHATEDNHLLFVGCNCLEVVESGSH